MVAVVSAREYFGVSTFDLPERSNSRWRRAYSREPTCKNLKKGMNCKKHEIKGEETSRIF